jgi:ribonucleoside-diphosphate reductase alpha chain
MTTRNRLPNRRANETINLNVAGQQYTATIGYDDNGHPAELFINAAKVDSAADINAADGAVAVSIALQYGASINTLRAAMKRNADGSPQGPLGAALDRAKRMENREK